MAYKWKYQMPVDAQTAGEELERISGKYGGVLLPENIVDESRDANAVLHNCFEWDNNIAAEKYRVEQARYIIRNIVCIVEKPAIEDGQTKTVEVVRAFVDVSEKPKGVFIPIKTALNQENYREKILRDALAELRMFQKKYRIYAELAGICKAIDNFAATLKVDG